MRAKARELHSLTSLRFVDANPSTRKASSWAEFRLPDGSLQRVWEAGAGRVLNVGPARGRLAKVEIGAVLVSEVCQNVDREWVERTTAIKREGR